MSSGLGRGLGSLIPPKNQAAADTGRRGHKRFITARGSDNEQTGGDRVLQIGVDKIEVNPMQPRSKFADYRMDELVESIGEHGIIQPLIVAPKGKNYELIAGERRWRAAKTAGLKRVPAIVRDAGGREKLEMALIENVQREDLNPIELANAYRKLINEFNLTQEEVAKRVGKSRSSVANTLRFLNLPEEIKLALIDGKITAGHAKYLLGLETEDKQMTLFRKILHGNLTVRDTTGAVRRMGGTGRVKVNINYRDKDKEFAFREFFGAKVEIRRKGRGGQVIIDFYSDEELAAMADKIRK